MIFSDIITAIWVVFLVYWAVSAAGAKKSIKGGWRRGAGFRLLAVIFIIFILQIPAVKGYVRYNFLTRPSYALQAIGVVLCAAGVAFAIWARRHLGRNWGMPMTMRTEPELVTSGPYKFVRHPIYTGMLLALLGSAMVSGTVWLAVFVFVLIYFAYSARTEERLMSEKFPDKYAEYKKRTRMLIPFIF